MKVFSVEEKRVCVNVIHFSCGAVKNNDSAELFPNPSFHTPEERWSSRSKEEIRRHSFSPLFKKREFDKRRPTFSKIFIIFLLLY